MSKPIYYRKQFRKNYKLRFANQIKTRKKAHDRISLFLEDRTNPVLRDHALIGSQNNERAFSITGDIRIVYIEFEDYYLFADIGTHNQVY